MKAGTRTGLPWHGTGLSNALAFCKTRPTHKEMTGLDEGNISISCDSEITALGKTQDYSCSLSSDSAVRTYPCVCGGTPLSSYLNSWRLCQKGRLLLLLHCFRFFWNWVVLMVGLCTGGSSWTQVCCWWVIDMLQSSRKIHPIYSAMGVRRPSLWWH